VEKLCERVMIIDRGRLLSARYRIRDLSVREPDIEATVRRIYEERLLEA
jgi:ABC-type uncharacterized transport system ATPase subunit